MTHSVPAVLPVYVQIAEALTHEIAAGRLVDGDRLPPERRMARDWGVSVGTLRKALAYLEERALLRRVQGSGNYVDASGARDSIYAMFRLELPEGGGLPRADLLNFEICVKPLDLPAFGVASSANRVRRLRWLNDTPVAVEDIWLDSGAGTLAREDLTPSLYQTYKSALGLWILRAEDRVSIGALPDWAPPQFGHPPGRVMGFIERFGWADESRPVEYSRTWFDPERAVYVQRLR